MAQMRVFVSHSHQDNEWCRPFVAALKSVGYDVWYDEIGLQGGSEWIRTLEREIEAREVFVVVLSPDALASDWVRREIDLALAAKRHLVPVMHELVPQQGFLRAVQWVDASGKDATDAARLTIVAIEAKPSAIPIPPAQSVAEIVLLCRALFHEKRYSETLATCDRVLSLDSDNSAAWAIKAATFLVIGDRMNSVQTLRSGYARLISRYDAEVASQQHSNDLFSGMFSRNESIHPVALEFRQLVIGAGISESSISEVLNAAYPSR